MLCRRLPRVIRARWLQCAARGASLVPHTPVGEVPPAAPALGTYDRSELLVLLETLSRSGVRGDVWGPLCRRARSEVASCSVSDLCVIVRALTRVGVRKKSLLNAICKRLRREAAQLAPRELSQVVSDLRRLGHLNGPLLLTLAGNPRLQEFDTFDLPLLLGAFAKTKLRDESRLCAVGEVLKQRQLCAVSAASALHSMASLDTDAAGAAPWIATSVVPRRLCDFEPGQLAVVAHALVMMDLPAGEVLSYVLERLTRHAKDLRPREVHALRIVEQCVLLPDALRPKMRASFEADPRALQRSVEMIRQVAEATSELEVPLFPTVSKAQRALERYFKELKVPHRAEGQIGPYLMDFVLPHRIAVEVDGYTHFYQFTRRPTAKSLLKLRVLRAMGWRVVQVPHFEWFSRNSGNKAVYLAGEIEAAGERPLSALQKARNAVPGVKKHRWQRRASRRGPARGLSGGTRL